MNKLITIILILFTVNCYSQQYIEFSDSLKADNFIQKIDVKLGYPNSHAKTYSNPVKIKKGYAVIIDDRIKKYLSFTESIKLNSISNIEFIKPIIE